jgi:hypothetical protein
LQPAFAAAHNQAVAERLHEIGAANDSRAPGNSYQNGCMDEAYVVCQERNTEAAYRRFFGPGFRYYPNWRQVARLALRHRFTAGLIVAMNAAGLLAYVWSLI